MPKPLTAEQRARQEMTYLKTLRRGALGDDKVAECFEVDDGVLYRKLRNHTMPSGETRAEFIALMDRLAEGMIPGSVRYEVGDDGSCGDPYPLLVCTGRRLATEAEQALYAEVTASQEEKQAKAKAERDMADLARLRKQYPDQFKET